ncbi:NAD(P)-binding domain-containing protein [Methylobacterium organophilum]|nr:NAD(P)-binding domain-containing protein [Methylobacterium organophilum]
MLHPESRKVQNSRALRITAGPNNELDSHRLPPIHSRRPNQINLPPFSQSELGGLTLGLVGFGAIGQATARLAAALGLRVLAYGPSRPDADFANAGALRAASVDALLAEADIVSLHVPLTTGTRGLIGRDQLARMKREAFLINTSRGGLIDEAALVEALEAGTIAGAGLDVFAQEPLPVDHPLARQPRAILTPHVGGSTGAALIRTAETAATRVVDVLAGRRPGGLVNPDVWERRRAP